MSRFQPERFACELDDASIVDAWAANCIVDNESFADAHGNEKLIHRQFKNHSSISKKFIPVDLSFFRQAVLTEVKANTLIKSHKHDEPMLRYVLDGSFALNGKQYSPGDWVLVPKNTDYEIHTLTGYKTLAMYGMCPCAEICYGDR